VTTAPTGAADGPGAPENVPEAAIESTRIAESGTQGDGPGVDGAADAATAGDETADGGSAAAGTLVDWLLVALITLLAAGAAVLGLAFLPMHIGAVPFPISALLGVGAMILGPRAAYRLTGSVVAAVLPVAAWFAVSVWLVLSRNTMMPGLPLTVIDGQWRVMVLLGLGSLAAAATLGLIWGDRLRDRLAAERAAAQARDDQAEDAAPAGFEPG
jgi:hypothetical protein